MSTLERHRDYVTQTWSAQFEEYKQQHPALFTNRVVATFFEQEKHQRLLIQSIRGEEGKEKELNESFRRYLFQYRFITYITLSLKFMSLDQMRRNQRYATRNVLIYDKPSAEDSDTRLGETITAYQASYEAPMTDEQTIRFRGGFENEQVESAFERLTEKQKKVTTLYYGQGYFDHEIASSLQVSQQAVAKTRNAALKKMKTILARGE
ncbi:sigma-70 family RNA polymerase sigma factor [Paenibacillus sp. FSL W8-0426]|uniref:sigma-70 family RNA polymerase sigma factor n=1 Tax=Paenibacillus sp. FSL W8-0426 TaxID=2921714 RepID=UPI0030DCC7B9